MHDEDCVAFVDVPLDVVFEVELFMIDFGEGIAAVRFFAPLFSFPKSKSKSRKLFMVQALFYVGD